ncbi:MAG: N-acetylmuramoyl-L-alanine amidase [Oscillospiraceae bacterium]|nr:N-acetylmuramoyl-L-alanine amidase [Oscillospiraceae bacterium]
MKLSEKKPSASNIITYIQAALFAAMILFSITMSAISPASVPAFNPIPEDPAETLGIFDLKGNYDGAINNNYVISPLFGSQKGKNLVIVKIDSLCRAVTDAGFAPKITSFINSSSCFDNYYSFGGYTPTDTDFVINTSVPSPALSDALSYLSEKSIISLSSVLKENGFSSASAFFTCDSHLGGRDKLFKLLGFDVNNTAAASSAYDAAAKYISESKESVFVYIEDASIEYPFCSASTEKTGLAGAYGAVVVKADGKFGAFTDTLKNKGLLENTVIILVGGGSAIDYNKKSDVTSINSIMPEDQKYTAEDYFHAPLAIYYDGINPKNYKAICGSTDIYPTVLDLFGIKQTELAFFGVNILSEDNEAEEEQHYSIPLGWPLRDGSFVSDKLIFAKTQASFSILYHTENDGKTAARSEATPYTKRINSIFKEAELYLSLELPGIIKEKGEEEAYKKFYAVKKRETKLESYPPASVVKPEMYKPEIDLTYRAKIFTACELNGKYDGTISSGNMISLRPKADIGTFVSNPIDIGAFKKLYLSWNASLRGGKISLSVALERKDGTFTDYYSWGTRSAKKTENASASRSDNDASLDIDTLLVRSQITGRVIVRAEITRGSSFSPEIYNITFTTDGEPSASFTDRRSSGVTSIKLDTSPRSQNKIPDIGSVICSPTSLSIVLDYLGKNIPTASVAAGVKDNAEGIYGNWSFNVAYAAENGFFAYVDLYNDAALESAVIAGTPVVCSIATSSVDELKGSTSAYPAGHLLCVIGFETKDGQMYYIVNDPCSSDDESALREYKKDEFLRAWNGIVYIIQKRPETGSFRIGEGTSEMLDVIVDYIDEDTLGRPGDVTTKKWIVIHNTGNYSSTADAKMHNEYIHKSTYSSTTSWHYTVDDHSIYQHIPDNERAFHAGDGGWGEGNAYGIGIEICVNEGGDFYAALDNAAQLVAELMIKNNLTMSSIKQHYDFNGKNCPQEIRERGLWGSFLENINNRYIRLKESIKK